MAEENPHLIKEIRQALIDLRKSRVEYHSYERFKQVSGIHRQTVENTEDGSSFPSVPTIQKWVEACGLTLSEFFKQFESGPPQEVRIIPAEKDYYKYLTRIFEAGIPFWTTGIKANLKAMAHAAEMEAAPNIHHINDGSTREQRENLRPKERIKSGKSRSR